MRILFAVVIAALFTGLFAGVSFAQMIETTCHEQDQGIATDMKKCICCRFEVMCRRYSESVDDALAGTGCCTERTCAGSPIHTDIALTVFGSPVVFIGKLLGPRLIQPAPLSTLAVHSSGIPPPWRPAAPAYIQNCSFLI